MLLPAMIGLVVALFFAIFVLPQVLTMQDTLEAVTNSGAASFATDLGPLFLIGVGGIVVIGTILAIQRFFE